MISRIIDSLASQDTLHTLELFITSLQFIVHNVSVPDNALDIALARFSALKRVTFLFSPHAWQSILQIITSEQLATMFPRTSKNAHIGIAAYQP